MLLRILVIAANYSDLLKSGPAPGFFVYGKPPARLGFRNFQHKPVIKTPFDLLKHLAVTAAAKVQQEIKRVPSEGRKELSAPDGTVNIT